MTLHEIDVAGIYIPPFIFYCAAALPPFFLLRWLMGRTGLLQLFWHPALVEAALYLIIVSLFILIPAGGGGRS